MSTLTGGPGSRPYPTPKAGLTKREQFANLQARVIGGVRMKVCTNCLKTMKKVIATKLANQTKKVVAKKA